MEATSRQCLHCGYETKPDDQMEGLSTASGRCVCVRCYHSMVDEEPHPMPKHLRDELERFVNLEIQ